MRQSTFAARIPERYLLLNIPAFEVQLIERGELALGMRAIVGKPSTPTPRTEGILSEIILNPYWNVPDSIARHEIVP